MLYILIACYRARLNRGCELDPVIKPYNREINIRRIGIEHVFSTLKTFKILAEHYQNRWKRIGLRSNLS
jgi:hypothetical protein